MHKQTDLVQRSRHGRHDHRDRHDQACSHLRLNHVKKGRGFIRIEEWMFMRSGYLAESNSVIGSMERHTYIHTYIDPYIRVPVWGRKRDRGSSFMGSMYSFCSFLNDVLTTPSESVTLKYYGA
jgi:hypothetical protein